MKAKPIRLILAVFSLGAMICLFYFDILLLPVNYRQEWNVYFVSEAHRLYDAGRLPANLPEHSLNGFPLIRHIIVSAALSIMLFVLMKLCLRIKTKVSIICPSVLLVLLLATITLSAVDYYDHDYRKSVEDAYIIHHESWWQEENEEHNLSEVFATLET